MNISSKSILDVLLTIALVIGLFTTLAMRDSLPRNTFVLILFVLVDVYALIGLLSIVSDNRSKWILAITYIAVSIYGYYGLMNAMERWRSDPGVASPSHNFMIGFTFTLLVSKFVFVLLLVFQDVGRMLLGTGQGIAGFINENWRGEKMIPGRRRVLSATAAGIAAIPFASMLYGISVGKYKYTVERLALRFKDLPKAFKGLKVVQISDAHAGSWDNVESVAKGIQKINDLAPDIIVFTGDLVNENKNEIDPYIHLFKSLKAPMGKYAVLGNHDYYGSPRDKADKPAYWQDFYNKYKAMGFDLIMNENRTISKDGDSIKLIGVENWGAGKWFPKKGDLDRACQGCTDEEFSILLSHDPTHFDEHVINHRKKVHLTLSGHTHGMQFGINLPNFKWSPVQYRYKKWMGLYEEKGQKLYVNRGFGFLGFPGRVGMWPEITMITLDT